MLHEPRRVRAGNTKVCLFQVDFSHTPDADEVSGPVQATLCFLGRRQCSCIETGAKGVLGTQLTETGCTSLAVSQ